MTTATDLDTLVGNGFTSAEKTSAITLAQKYLGTSDGDSNAKDLATATLARNILIDRRNTEKGKTDDNPTPISKLISDDIRALMAEEEKATSYKVVHYKKPTVAWRS